MRTHTHTHTKSCRKPLSVHILGVGLHVCFLFTHKHTCTTTTSRCRGPARISSFHQFVCMCLFFCRTNIYLKAERALSKETHFACVVEKGHLKPHTRDMHAQIWSDRKESIRRRSVRVHVTERARQPDGTWERRAERLQAKRKKREEEEGRETAVVSWIESRGGRCLFINASWLLKGAFDWAKTHGPLPLSTHLPPPTTGRPQLLSSRQQSCRGAEGGAESASWGGFFSSHLCLPTAFSKNQAHARPCLKIKPALEVTTWPVILLSLQINFIMFSSFSVTLHLNGNIPVSPPCHAVVGRVTLAWAPTNLLKWLSLVWVSALSPSGHVGLFLDYHFLSWADGNYYIYTHSQKIKHLITPLGLDL